MYVQISFADALDMLLAYTSWNPNMQKYIELLTSENRYIIKNLIYFTEEAFKVRAPVWFNVMLKYFSSEKIHNLSMKGKIHGMYQRTHEAVMTSH